MPKRKPQTTSSDSCCVGANGLIDSSIVYIQMHSVRRLVCAARDVHVRLCHVTKGLHGCGPRQDVATPDGAGKRAAAKPSCHHHASARYCSPPRRQCAWKPVRTSSLTSLPTPKRHVPDSTRTKLQCRTEVAWPYTSRNIQAVRIRPLYLFSYMPPCKQPGNNQATVYQLLPCSQSSVTGALPHTPAGPRPHPAPASFLPPQCPCLQSCFSRYAQPRTDPS